MAQQDTYTLLRHWAWFLGWRGLRRLQYTVHDSGDAQLDGRVITWYESGSLDNVFLQINESPPWHAAVYAMRYRVCTGWHKFRLYRDVRRLKGEAERLRTFLNRSWFDSARNRREFRRIHPECAGWTWKRLRMEGPPHDYGPSR